MARPPFVSLGIVDMLAACKLLLFTIEDSQVGDLVYT